MSYPLTPISEAGSLEGASTKPSLQEKQSEVIQRIASLGFSLEIREAPPSEGTSHPISREKIKPASTPAETYATAIHNIRHHLKALEKTYPTHSVTIERLLKGFKQLKRKIPEDSILKAHRLISDTESLLRHIREKEEIGAEGEKRLRPGEEPTEEPARKLQEIQPKLRLKGTKRKKPTGRQERAESERKAKKKKRAEDVTKKLSLTTTMGRFASTRAKPISGRGIERLYKKKQAPSEKQPLALTAEKTESVRSTLGTPNPIERAMASPCISVSEKLLFHLLGDPLGTTNEDLVGLSQVEGWQSLSSLLAAVSDAGDDSFREEVLLQKDLIDQGLEIYKDMLRAETEPELFDLIMLKLQRLLNTHPGERCIIPGGWKGDPAGHAMVYEFRKSQTLQGKYTLLIHNVGGGIQYHPQEIIEGRTQVTCYTIDNVEISKKTLEPFTRCVKELSTLQLGVNWSEDHVYGALSAALKSTKTSVSHPIYTDTQRSGICSFASYFAFLESSMDTKQYGRLRLVLGLRTLLRFVETIEDKSSEDAIALARRCSTYFSRMLMQGMQEKWMTEEDCFAIQHHLSTLEEKISSFEIAKAREKSLLQKPVSPASKENEMTLTVEDTTFTPMDVAYTPPGVTPLGLPQPALMPLSTIQNASEINVYIKKIVDWAQKEEGNDEDAHFEIGMLSRKILETCQLYSKEIKSLPKDVKDDCIKNLSLLGSLYVCAIVSARAREDKKFVTSPEILVPLFRLVSAASIVGADNELIRRFPCSFPIEFVFPPSYLCEDFAAEQNVYSEIEQKHTFSLANGYTFISSEKFFTFLKNKYGKKSNRPIQPRTACFHCSTPFRPFFRTITHHPTSRVFSVSKPH